MFMHVLQLSPDSSIRTIRFQTNVILFCALSLKNKNNKTNSSSTKKNNYSSNYNNNNDDDVPRTPFETYKGSTQNQVVRPPPNISYQIPSRCLFWTFPTYQCCSYRVPQMSLFRNRSPSKRDKFAGPCNYYHQLRTVALLLFQVHQSCMLNIIRQWVYIHCAIHKKKPTQNL